MNRDEFKLHLAARLHALSDDERAEVFSFFDECIDEALENGENEADALERLGSPDEVAEQLLADRELKSAEPKHASDSANDYDPELIVGIRVEAHDAGVRVQPSSSKNISVRYEVHQDEEFSVNVEDGVLVVRERLQRRWMHWLKGMISLGWDNWRWAIELDMPRRFDGYVDLTSSNHPLSVERLRLSSLSAKTSNSKVTVDGIAASDELTVISSNGMTRLQNSTAEGDVHVRTSNGRAEVSNVSSRGTMMVMTSNGRLSIEDCTAAAVSARTSNSKAKLTRVAAGSELTVDTSNGSIEVRSIGASDLIKLASSNASIVGTVKGNASQYTVMTRTSNGKALPPVGGDGPIRLEADTSNGRIDINFEEQ